MPPSMPACLIDATANARPVYAIGVEALKDWISQQSPAIQKWLSETGVVDPADPDHPHVQGGETIVLPDFENSGEDGGAIGGVLYIIGGNEERGGPWAWASLSEGLKTGVYEIVSDLNPEGAYNAALGFALADYRFERYVKGAHKDTEPGAAPQPRGAELVWPQNCDRAAVRGAHGAAVMVRDLINTPACDLGPAELAATAKNLAEASGAEYRDVVGVDLIRADLPAIYAVGRGAESSRAPRLIEFIWGRADAPRVTLVGKGVTFDTGGLNIKSTSGMKLMKKDMGGAAHALGLASMIMAAQLDVRLQVIIAAVENSVSNAAMRPQDIIATRKGLTLEIGNTDAEGRVILADALALACEDKPDILLDFATLTGAARVALGTDLPALFSNDDTLAKAILRAGRENADPLWQLPLHRPYEKQIKSKIADLRNDTDGPYGGAITAALFLQAFVDEGITWAHMDLMGWNLSSNPGRPEGGEAMAIRAVFGALADRFAT